MVAHGAPEYIPSDNGRETAVKSLRNWLGKLGTRNLYIEPEGRWESGYCESFDGKPRDELPNGDIFYALRKAQVLTEQWR